MDLFIVLLAVGASAVFIVRRLWKAFTRSPEQGCSEGCAGCSCASGLKNGMPDSDCLVAGQPPMNGSKTDDSTTASRK